MRRRFLIAIPWLSLSPVYAPTQEQIELYERADQAFDAGQYDDAAQDLRGAIELGSLNVLWLSLGRAEQRIGRCDEAKRAYEIALEAPAVPEPPAEAVRGRVDQYLAELGRTCPGTVEVVCSTRGTLVSREPGKWEACEAVSWELAAGAHRIVAKVGDVEAHYDVDVEAFESTRLLVGLAPAPHEPPIEPSAEEDHPGRSPMVLAGQITLGTGAALLATALTLDLAGAGPAVDRFEDARDAGDADAESLQRRARAWQAGALSTYVIGAAAAVTGAVLWGVGSRRAGRRTVAAGASLGPHGGGLFVRGRF